MPVALNYDRVLEDKILTSAARIGQRRFKARIGIIMFRMLRQFLAVADRALSPFRLCCG